MTRKTNNLTSNLESKLLQRYDRVTLESFISFCNDFEEINNIHLSKAQMAQFFTKVKLATYDFKPLENEEDFEKETVSTMTNVRDMKTSPISISKDSL